MKEAKTASIGKPIANTPLLGGSNFTTNAYRDIFGMVTGRRAFLVILSHAAIAAVANYLAFFVRFEGVIPHAHLRQMLVYLPLLLLLRIALFVRGSLHRHLWRYASVGDLLTILKAITAGSLVFFIAVRYLIGDLSYPRSVFILDWLLAVMLSGGMRLVLRIFREYLTAPCPSRRVLIVGSGDAGEMIVRDMKNNPGHGYLPVGFVDEDPMLKGYTINGVPILGPRSMIGDIIRTHRPDEVLVCSPSNGSNVIKELYDSCRPFNLPIKKLPAISEILNGDVSVSMIKPISMEDLLSRAPVRTESLAIKGYIEGRSVLVTGAGGSIGSELARHIAGYGPSDLVLLDRYENGLFSVDLELRNRFPGTRISTVIGDVLDHGLIERVFTRHRPSIVYHAAAHKHVPLMETNPIEAVKNNIFGTKRLAEAADRHGTESFVLISTDKAVNPTSIMGVTKRVAEMITLVMNGMSGTRFTTVRFGNVIGSNGSVYHIFSEQIRQGGPITVTHPDMKRYFMLTSEAVHLVLTASAAGEGGEIFVLDMGEPVGIMDFAESFIRLSGLVPHRDIKIEFTGLRPGEKISEDLFDETEQRVATFHEKIMMAVPGSPPGEDLFRHIESLEYTAFNNHVGELVPALRHIVNNFRVAYFVEQTF